MMMKSLEKNTEYKQQKKLLKEIEKKKKSIEKRKVYIEWLKRRAIEKAKSSINDRYEKKKALFESKKIKELEKLKKNLERVKKWKKTVKYKKKDKTLAWYKDHSCIDFQWCVRYDAQDINGYVRTIDWKIRKRYACDAGHIFSKSKHKNLIFNRNNCFPQSKYSNKELGATDWLQFKDEVIKRIGIDNWTELVRESKNKEAHNKILDKAYWKEKYEYWHNERLLRKKEIEDV